MMDRRENYLRYINHEPHDHVPCGADVCMLGGDNELFDSGPLEGGVDGFGVRWVKTASGMGAGTPAPGSACLEDIGDWETVVRFPDVSTYDWEAQTARQLSRWNPETQIKDYGCWNGQFLRLTHLMGFENALIALYEEPEACADLLSAITDYRISTLPYIKKWFDPDIVTIFDDVASSSNLFIAPDIYQELIAPQHNRWFDAVRELGIIPSIHICGRCADIVPGLPDEGAEQWQICEPQNDLVALSEAVGDRLAFFGGLAMAGELACKVPTDEELAKAARDAIDLYAPAGNYAFMGMIVYDDVELFFHAMQVMNAEGIAYGTNYYI